MPNDQYGRPVAVGDTVTIKGKLVIVSPNPEYLNCSVLLAQPLPPTGSTMTIQLNTQQLVVDNPGSPTQPMPIEEEQTPQ